MYDKDALPIEALVRHERMAHQEWELTLHNLDCTYIFIVEVQLALQSIAERM